MICIFCGAEERAHYVAEPVIRDDGEVRWFQRRLLIGHKYQAAGIAESLKEAKERWPQVYGREK